MDIVSRERIIRLLICLMFLLLINPVHEWAHAYVAHRLGDDTAKNAGRMTLSPFAHIDIWGALLLLTCGFGWAKPVPVNPSNFRNPRRDTMLTSIAGPAANVAAALVGVIILRLGAHFFDAHPMVSFAVLYFVTINLNLCLFNLLPVPPLDGSRVLTYFLPPSFENWIMRYQGILYIVVIVLMVSGALSRPISYLNNALQNLLFFITGWIPALF